MACNIQYTEVKLIGNTLIVRGTAESCSGVVVDLEDVVVTNPKNATFIRPGVWEVILTATDIAEADPAITNFDGLRIKCGENINLHAVCLDDVNCTGPANFILSCEDCIQYTEVKLVGNTLTVRGTAELCSEVIVVVESGVVTNPKNAPVNSAGDWVVIFTAADIADENITNFDGLRKSCGTNIKLSAVCVDDKNCTGPADFILTCENEVACPSATGTHIIRGCELADANGNPRVDFVLTFNPPIPQGAFAQVIWTYGGDNADHNATATELLPTSAEPMAQYDHHTFMPPRPPFGSPPCSYSASAVITVIINGQLCTIAPIEFCLTVNSCLPCPGDPTRNRPPVTLTITTPNAWCAPPQAGQAATFAAVVNFPAGTPGPPVPSAFDWTVTTPDIPSRVFKQRTEFGSTTTASGWQLNDAGVTSAVDLSRSGDYAVSVAVLFAPDAGLPTDPDGTPSCNVSASGSFPLESCGGLLPCPSITAINVTPACADPAAGVAANVDFTVVTNDPSGLISGFEWDFGDPASGDANQAQTATPNATHTYSGTGNFTVTVRVNSSDCTGGGPRSVTTLVSVPLCPCPPGQVRDANGRCVVPPGNEDFGCKLLRELLVGFAALAILGTMLAFCLFVPGSGPFWIVIGVAGGLALAAAIMFGFWLFLPCPRPCGWGLLMAGQIVFGAGWGAVYFFFCCVWIGWVGLGLLLLSAVLLGLWINECRPTVCTVFIELAWVLTVVILPLISFILFYPPAALCALSSVIPIPIPDVEILSGSIAALLTIIAASIIGKALSCAEE